VTPTTSTTDAGVSPNYQLRILEVLLEVRDEIRALRLLQEEARRPERGDGRQVDFVRAIRETVGSRVFTSSELVHHAQLVPLLNEAIISALGALNTRKVGRFLRRIEGRDFDGTTIVRVGEDSSGLVWAARVSRVSTAKTPLQIA
jgi:hypothetical protein